MSMFAVVTTVSFSLLLSGVVSILDADTEDRDGNGILTGYDKGSLDFFHIISDDVDFDDYETEEADSLPADDILASTLHADAGQLYPEHLRIPKPFCRS